MKLCFSKLRVRSSVLPVLFVALCSPFYSCFIPLALSQSNSGSNDNTPVWLFAVLFPSNVTSSSNNGSTASATSNSTKPTVTYSSTSFSFPVNTAISTQTPTITATPLTNCVSSPTLPTGLTLNTSSCAISGTPSSVQSSTAYVITASNSAGTGTTTLNITITATAIAPGISYTGSPYTFNQNAAISSLTPTLTGNSPTSCLSAPTLPTGLSINNTTCVITGTPTGTQTATNHTITATNGAGNGQTIINITVSAAGTAPVVSYSGSPFSYTQNTSITTLTAALSGNAPTSCSAAPSLPAGLSISNTTCAISGTPTVTQGSTVHTITASNTFGSGQTTINITVNAAGVAPTISYSGSPFSFTQNSAITTLNASLTGNTPTSCTSAPSLPTGLSINNTTCAISGNPSVTQVATSHTITATNAFGSGQTSINITVGAVPTVSYSGSPYSYPQAIAISTLTPTLGGNATTSCSSSPTLPAGLTISNTTCSITGTPTTPQGATDYTITAANTYGNGTVNINITVTAGTAPTLNYTGSPFSSPINTGCITTWTPTLTGNPPTSCSSSPALPNGSTLTAPECTISCFSTSTSATANYTITATNAYGSTNTVVSITFTP